MSVWLEEKEGAEAFPVGVRASSIWNAKHAQVSHLRQEVLRVWPLRVCHREWSGEGGRSEAEKELTRNHLQWFIAAMKGFPQ